VETFVDPSLFQGTCYKAVGFFPLGQTKGFRKSRQGYQEHGNPKLLFVRLLHPKAIQLLSSPFPSSIFFSKKEVVSIKFTPDLNQLPLQGQGSLMEFLYQITDPRKPRGVRHSLVSILALSIEAALCGMRSFVAIAQWAESLPEDTLKKFGCKRNKPPCESTIRRTLQQINAEEVDQKIGEWLVANYVILQGKLVVFDGKTLRGAYDTDKQIRAPHLLSAILAREKLVVAQHAVGEKTNEIPEMKPLLDPLPLEGCLVGADAMHTQTETARYLVEEKKADYIFTVKDNQPTLKKDIEDLKLLELPPSFQTVDKGHGRIETRTIRTSTELNDYLTFPYVGQVFCIERHRTNLKGEKPQTEVVYGITSLSPEKADAAKVLDANRKQWSIENSLHWVRDVTFDEDRSRVRTGAGAQMMTSLRNVVINLLRIMGANNIAEGLRFFMSHREQTPRIFGIPSG